MKQDVTIKGAAHSSIIHDSAIKHVTGRAEYTDDLNEPAGTLHAYLGLSTVAHGRITSLDLDAQAGEDAKYSVQLENCGKVEKIGTGLQGTATA